MKFNLRINDLEVRSCEPLDGDTFDDFLSAKEGFEELVSRLNKKIKKHIT